MAAYDVRYAAVFLLYVLQRPGRTFALLDGQQLFAAYSANVYKQNYACEAR